MKLHYKITQSEYTENPLDWTTPGERGAWFVMSHKRYSLPNELDVDFEEYDSWNELAEKASDKPYMFVRWYEHSGISVQLRDNPDGQDWDAGIVGVIFGNTTEDIKREFASWSCYIEGDIWDVEVLDENDTIVDYSGACELGIYGHEYATSEAERMLKDAQAEQDEHDKRERQAQKELKTAKTLAKKHGYILAREV